jgi:dTDP-4-dehydrorhamnose reductase
MMLFGSSGQLGRELLRVFSPIVDIEAPTRDEVDMQRPETATQAINGFSPQWIINAAAYTAVDRAETDTVAAQAVNTDSVRAIAEEAARVGAAVIHYSTDYVFSGNNETPYLETDPTMPLNAYGRTKQGGEWALEHSRAAHLIFRISWLYGAAGANFLRTILRIAHKNAATNTPVRIVNDQHGIPTWTRDVANATLTVVQRINAEAETADKTPAQALALYNGIYHLSGSNQTTWYGFAAEALVQLSVLMPEIHWAGIVPIATAEYQTPAARPKNSCLDSSKIKSAFNIVLPPWQDSLTEVLKEIAANGVESLG